MGKLTEFFIHSLYYIFQKNSLNVIRFEIKIVEWIINTHVYYSNNLV